MLVPRVMRLTPTSIGVLAACAGAVGCGGLFEGLPRYVDARPPALARSAEPRAKADVKIYFAPVAINTWLGAGPNGGRQRGDEWNFRLALSSAETETPLLTTLGDVRTADVTVPDYAALACAYMALPAGETARPCVGIDAAEAQAKSKPVIEGVIDDLRALVASAGGDAVAQVRCFAHALRKVTWCEGIAAVVPKPVAVSDDRPPVLASAIAPELRPNEQPRTATHRVGTELKAARVVLGASTGAMVTSHTQGATAAIHLLARPVDVSARGALVPSVVVGEVDVAARRQIASSWVDVLAGAGFGAAWRYTDDAARGVRSSIPVFVGAHFQPRSSGRALEPFVRARGGYRFVVADAGGHGDLAAPFGDLTVGVYWPELR